jgi:short-subunit dehydrogenase
MFTNCVALVTGASAGIGLAVSRKLAALGCKVALVARTRSKLEQAASGLGAGKAAAFPLDVADLAALERLPAQVVERFGRLDFVVNNAGLHHRGPFVERTPAELAQMVAVNLSAPIVLARAAVPFLKPGSAIVNVASLAGFVPVRDAATYSGTKAGLRAFGFAAAEELAPRGISVCTVSPGPVDTDFFGEELPKVTPITFSQPMSTPEEVADAVLACLRTGAREIAMPWFSGKLATLAYLSPRLLRLLRPMMERIGAKKKAAFAARKAR